jgi:hypothetical protein
MSDRDIASRSGSSPRHAARARHVLVTCCLSVVILGAIAFAAGVSAAAPPDEVTITFVAQTENRDTYTRLTGVKPSGDSLKLIELHPGDVVVYEVKRVEVVVEKWSQEWKWEVEHKEGKDTIKEQTTQWSYQSTKLKWGVSVAPKFVLGNVEIDLSKEGRQEIQAQQAFVGTSAKVGFSGVQVNSKPSIRRPPTAPANATAGPVKLETTDATGKVVADNAVLPNCTLTIKINRASAEN